MSARNGRPWNKSKHSVRRDGMTHLICGICGTEGPPHASNTDARKRLADDGWSRCYTGSEDQLRCPDCRSIRRPGRNHTPTDGEPIYFPDEGFEMVSKTPPVSVEAVARTVAMSHIAAERDAAVAQRDTSRAQMQSLTESFVEMEARAVTAERERDAAVALHATVDEALNFLIDQARKIAVQRDAAVARADRLTAAIGKHLNDHIEERGERFGCCCDDEVLWSAAFDREDTPT